MLLTKRFVTVEAGMRRATTLKQVAAEAGVSQATVSAVLSGKHPHVRVSEETRSRILATVRRLEYRPNAVARSLSSRITNIIGAYSSFGTLYAGHSFYSEILGGLQNGCAAQNKNLLLFHPGLGDQSSEEVFAQFVDGKIDGLIVFIDPQLPILDSLRTASIPVVALTDPLPGIPSVGAEDAQGARLLVDYLAAKGHRRFLIHNYEGSGESVRRRGEAFRGAVAGYGLTAMVLPAEGREDASERDHYQALLAAWRAVPAAERPTVALGHHDADAYTLAAYCAEQQVGVPDDLAITGFDGLATGPGTPLRLTTIHVPWASVAETAVSVLVAKIRGEEVLPETLLPVELRIGDSA